MNPTLPNFLKLISALLLSASLLLPPGQAALANTTGAPAPTISGPFASEKTVTWGGSGDDFGLSSQVDATGHIYVSGTFTGSVDFDPGSGTKILTSNGGRDVFLSKFDSSRNLLWTKTWGGSADERGEGLALDSLGNVYVSGPFQGTVQFNPAGGASHSSNAGPANNIFLSKFTPAGTFVWVKTWGPADGGAEGYDISIDGQNNVYVVGDFSGTSCDFNPWGAHDIHINHAPAPGNPRLFDAFLSKFDANGNFLWARTWGGDGYDDGPGVATDSLGNVYVGGMYQSQLINFDPSGATNTGGTTHPAHDDPGIPVHVDVFLSKFDKNGNFLWVRTWGGRGTDEVGARLAVDSLNNIYLSGRFGCTSCDLNPDGTSAIHSTHGDLDAFVSKYDANGTFLWARTWGGTGMDAAAGLLTDTANNLYVTGVFSGSPAFGPGSSATSKGGLDAFLTKFNPAGTFLGLQTWGGDGSDGGNRLARDAAGSIYAVGWFSATVDFDPSTLTDGHLSNGLADAYLTVLKPGQPAAPLQRIKNGGFNNYPSASLIPTNWSAAQFGPGDGKNTTAVKEGSAALKISGSSGKIKTLTQILALAGGSAETFNFSFYLRGASIPTGPGLCQAQLLFYSGTTLAQTKTINCPTGTYTTYLKKALLFTTTSAYTKIIIKLTYTKPTGTAWFDAISLLR